MSIVIDIVTQFRGQGNIQKLDSDLDKLSRTAKAFAGSFLVEQVVSRSLDAFKAESFAVTTLTNSLRNLGIAYKDIQPSVEANNEKMANLGFKSSESVDALAKLTTAIGNPAKALEIMGTVADLARYKQKSLGETATLVAKAIAGNSRAFADLGLKVDKNLTPMNSFNKLVDQSKAKVGGLALAYSKTAAGALDVFSAKTENASAKLGQALAPAIAKLADLATKYLIPIIDQLTSNPGAYAAIAAGIYLVSSALGSAAKEAALLDTALLANPIFLALAAAGSIALLISKFSKAQSPISANIGAPYSSGGKSYYSTSQLSLQGRVNGGVGTQFMAKDKQAYEITGYSSDSRVTFVKKINAITTDTVKKNKELTASEKTLAALNKQWAADAAKQNAAMLKQQQDSLKLEKDKLALKKASTVLDQQAIEIAAALQNKNLTELDKASLNLQSALLQGKADEATKLATQIAAITESTKAAADHYGASSYGTSSTGTSTPPSTGTGMVNNSTISQSGPIIYVTPAFQFNIDGSVITDAVTLQQIQNTAAGVAGSYNRSQTFIY